MDGTSVRSGLAQNSSNQSVVQPAADSCSSRAARSVAVMSVLRIAGADGDRLVGFGVRWAARPGTGDPPRPGGSGSVRGSWWAGGREQGLGDRGEVGGRGGGGPACQDPPVDGQVLAGDKR